MVKDDISGVEVPLLGKSTYHVPLSFDDPLPQNWVLVGDPGRVETFSQMFDDVLLEKSNREFNVAVGLYKDVGVGLLSTGIGVDNTTIALMELHVLNDYDFESEKWVGEEPLTIIRAGTSGSPNPSIKVPSLVVSDYAIGMDNTAIKYLFKNKGDLEFSLDGERYEYDEELSELFFKVKQELKEVEYVSRSSPVVAEALMESVGSFPVELGITVSTQDFYAGQGRMVGGLSKISNPNMISDLGVFEFDDLPVANMEMETSLLFRLSRILGYRAGSVCSVLANRVTGQAVTGEQYVASVEACGRASLDALVSLT
ncbi:MAG: nucleoside phosphorylase [Nanoarchaeota archaeon]|nr:nucleoside phosphorylase [Nanoarchaeota archaeon]